MCRRTLLYAGVREEDFSVEGFLGPEASDLSTALDASLQRPSVSGSDPVPRPPPRAFTHLWPAIPVPASLGMKSQTKLPGDFSVEDRGEILKCPLWQMWGDDSQGVYTPSRWSNN